MNTRIYLDNAATSWPKRSGVKEAVHAAFDLGASYGRGQSMAADSVRRVVERCRTRVAGLVGVTDSSRVVFTSGGTESLNLAIFGLLEPGDRVIATQIDHNSVLRPVYEAQRRLGVELEVVAADSEGFIDEAAFEVACNKPAKLVVINHASNVTGALQDARRLAELAHKAGAIVLLDACQTAGHVPIDFQSTGADIVAMSGHKGLGGPLGTGVVAFADSFEELPRPFRLGGTGGRSELTTPPDELPDRYEAGSHNVPGLFGLDAALETLKVEIGPLNWIDELASIPGVTLHGPASTGQRVGVASISVDGWSPHDLATVLESEFGIEVRAGLHCAPLAHKAIGTFDAGGTVRFSPSPEHAAEPTWIESLRSIVS